MGNISTRRFLILRRITQVTVIFLLYGGGAYGWSFFKGNLSSSKILGKVPLSDPFALLQIAATGRAVSGEAILGGLIVVLFFGLFAGRAFCSWICPVNLVTDLANRIRAVLRIGRQETRLSMPRYLRYWALSLSLILSSLLGIAAFEWISPVSMVHRGIAFGMGFGWAAVAGIFLFDLFILKNGFCGHLCPLGGFYSVIARFSVLRVFHRKDACTLCMKCVEVCPEDQVLQLVGDHTGMVLSGECVNCGRCIEVCPAGAMKFINKLFTERERRS